MIKDEALFVRCAALHRVIGTDNENIFSFEFTIFLLYHTVDFRVQCQYFMVAIYTNSNAVLWSEIAKYI